MRHVEYATSIAKSANARGYHFGAVIFNGRDVVSTGWCQCKTHPRQAKFMRYAKSYKRSNSFLHAEVHALIAARTDVSGCDIVVARWAEGKPRDSHPCEACAQALSVAGIRRTWFFSDGIWKFRNS